MKTARDVEAVARRMRAYDRDQEISADKYFSHRYKMEMSRWLKWTGIPFGLIILASGFRGGWADTFWPLLSYLVLSIFYVLMRKWEINANIKADRIWLDSIEQMERNAEKRGEPQSQM